MLKGYDKEILIRNISHNCSLFKAVKNLEHYFMFEYIEINQSDQYNFKVMKKLNQCSHVLKFIQKFQHEHRVYFITEYFPSNLLEEQIKRPNKIYQISQALQIFGQIVQMIEQIHQNNIIYRNFQLEAIGKKGNQIFLSDFRFSQIVKRKQKYSELVGNVNYMAPQFYSKEGYSYEVDVWAAGVCLFYMLTGDFPFDCLNKNKEQILKLIKKKCKNGFSFRQNLIRPIKQKIQDYLQDLFTKIFCIQNNQRITVAQIKKSLPINYSFEIKKLSISKQMSLSVINEEGSNIYQSIFPQNYRKSPWVYQLSIEEIILNFMEHSSEILMLNLQSPISQQLRNKVNFSILKVALLKAMNVLDIIYGVSKSSFKIQSQQWQKIKKTTFFTQIKQKIEKKKKIIQMLYKSAWLKVKNQNEKSSFYSQQIPSDFESIKQQLSYKLVNIEKIFRKCLMKRNRQQKRGKIVRRLEKAVRTQLV